MTFFKIRLIVLKFKSNGKKPVHWVGTVADINLSVKPLWLVVAGFLTTHDIIDCNLKCETVNSVKFVGRIYFIPLFRRNCE